MGSARSFAPSAEEEDGARRAGAAFRAVAGVILKHRKGRRLFPTLPTLRRIPLVFSVGLAISSPGRASSPIMAVVRKTERVQLPERPDGKDMSYRWRVAGLPRRPSGNAMKRTWTIIGVPRRTGQLQRYQSLFGQPETPPAHDHFGQILDTDGTVLLCLHRWGAHEHPSLMSPDKAPPGNGLLCSSASTTTRCP